MVVVYATLADCLNAMPEDRAQHAKIIAICAEMGIDPVAPMTSEQHREFASRLAGVTDDPDFPPRRVWTHCIEAIASSEPFLICPECSDGGTLNAIANRLAAKGHYVLVAELYAEADQAHADCLGCHCKHEVTRPVPAPYDLLAPPTSAAAQAPTWTEHVAAAPEGECQCCARCGRTLVSPYMVRLNQPAFWDEGMSVFEGHGTLPGPAALCEAVSVAAQRP